MINTQRVESHYQVESGDVLIHVETKGRPTESFKLLTSNWFGTMAHFFQLHFINPDEVVLTLVKYESPLKQKVLKNVILK